MFEYLMKALCRTSELEVLFGSREFHDAVDAFVIGDLVRGKYMHSSDKSNYFFLFCIMPRNAIVENNSGCNLHLFQFNCMTALCKSLTWLLFICGTHSKG